MTGFGTYIPAVEASGAIFNPWYQLPRIYVVSSDPSTRSHKPHPPITPVCRAGLPLQGLKLFFKEDRIAFIGETDRAHKLVDPLLYFITYRSFIKYDIFSATSQVPAEAEYAATDRVPFTLQRIVRIERETVVDGESAKALHFEGRQESRELTVESMARFLAVLNQPLYASLVFYLRGCANPMYFLVEYYKAVESIIHAYGGERRFFGALGQYGITKKRHSQFGKIANDASIAPVDIGRHAPALGAAVYSFDVRTIHYDERSRQIFETSTEYCRDVIDAYIAKLSTHEEGS